VPWWTASTRPGPDAEGILINAGALTPHLDRPAGRPAGGGDPVCRAAPEQRARPRAVSASHSTWQTRPWA
jgi:hypothetical protein